VTTLLTLNLRQSIGSGENNAITRVWASLAYWDQTRATLESADTGKPRPQTGFVNAMSDIRAAMA